ncbi:MAG: hypothetical protein ISS93_00295 [Candidatus Aenigmarchaeota archaeon]|nr:hypothetical protein [Candidatus Aenigmarchaeota archaeon]
MQKIAVLPILAVLIVSGCVSTVGGNGVIIENFEPDFADAFGGEKITFQAKIRNTGSVGAKDVHAHVIGLGEWGAGTTGGAKSDKIEMDCNGKKGVTLLPPQPDFGTTGEVAVCSLLIQAPTPPKGLPVTYQPGLRVYYKYSSSVIKSINVGSQQELRRIQNTGAALPTETVSQTSGPVAITVVSKGPIRMFGSEVEFPVEITVSNVGGGVVCSSNCDDKGSNWNRIKISTEFSGKQINDCSKEFTLFRGQSNTIVCKLKISDAPTSGVIQKSVSVEASNYGYFIDSATSVEVNPSLAPSSGVTDP